MAVENGGSGAMLVKVLGFSVALVLVFTLVANTLPQVEGEAPEETEIDLGALTMEDFVALGENLFMAKGTCTLCHKPPPLGRAPDIQGDNMVEVADNRLADERYQGAATDAAGYIHESMVEPHKYVVEGWGVKGSNDSQSPMPKVDAAPIELTEIEMDAIIAYLQAKDGHEVTVSLPEAGAVPATEESAVGAAPAPAATAEEAIAKYGCQACHSLLGVESPVGPDLNDVGERLDKALLWESIVDPEATPSEGFPAGLMPGNFAERMTVKELNMIVDLLAENKS